MDTTHVVGSVHVVNDSNLTFVRVVGDSLMLISDRREWPFIGILQTLLGGVLAILAGFGGKLFEQWVTRRTRRRDFEELVRADVGAAAVTARQVANSVRTTGELWGAALDHLQVTTATVEAARDNIALITDPSIRTTLAEWIGLLHVIRKATQDLRERMRNAGPDAIRSPEYNAIRGALASQFNLLAREGAFIVEMLGGSVALPEDPPTLGPSVDPNAAEKEAWRTSKRGKSGNRRASPKILYRINRT